MRAVMKGVVTAVVVAAAVLVAVVAAPAQTLGPRGPAPDWLAPEGPGSAIAATVRDPDKTELSNAKLATPAGAFIEEVRENGAAARAGLKAGDLVVEFDGERVRSAQHFVRLVRETPPGRSTRVVVVRAASRMTLDVAPEAPQPLELRVPQLERDVRRQLESLPRDFELDLDLEGPRRGIVMAPRGWLGAQITPMPDQLATYFGTKGGVLVSSVDAESAAAKGGLKAGDVLTSINGRSIESPDDLLGELARARPGDSLTLNIVRDKKASTLKATLPERPTGRSVIRARPI